MTMKIALIGASGNVGSRIVAELSSRGHQITAIARNPGKIAALPGIRPTAVDIADTESLAAILKGHVAVISSVHFTASDPDQLIRAVKASGVPRYLVVGGAGSLQVAPGKLLVDSPDFPKEYESETRAGCVFLDRLRAEKNLDWTFLSPSYVFQPGERTGKFRLGKDDLLVNDKGSSISFEDFAVALADEIETPKHSRQRFTVGY
jgi:putative NADH-flavin reductase